MNTFGTTNVNEIPSPTLELVDNTNCEHECINNRNTADNFWAADNFARIINKRIARRELTTVNDVELHNITDTNYPTDKSSNNSEKVRTRYEQQQYDNKKRKRCEKRDSSYNLNLINVTENNNRNPINSNQPLESNDLSRKTNLNVSEECVDNNNLNQINNLHVNNSQQKVMNSLQPNHEEQEENDNATGTSTEEIETNVCRKKRRSSQKNRNSYQLRRNEKRNDNNDKDNNTD